MTYDDVVSAIDFFGIELYTICVSSSYGKRFVSITAHVGEDCTFVDGVGSSLEDAFYDFTKRYEGLNFVRSL